MSERALESDWRLSCDRFSAFAGVLGLGIFDTPSDMRTGPDWERDVFHARDCFCAAWRAGAACGFHALPLMIPLH